MIAALFLSEKEKLIHRSVTRKRNLKIISECRDVLLYNLAKFSLIEIVLAFLGSVDIIECFLGNLSYK